MYVKKNNLPSFCINWALLIIHTCAQFSYMLNVHVSFLSPNPTLPELPLALKPSFALLPHRLPLTHKLQACKPPLACRSPDPWSLSCIWTFHSLHYHPFPKTVKNIFYCSNFKCQYRLGGCCHILTFSAPYFTFNKLPFLTLQTPRMFLKPFHPPTNESCCHPARQGLTLVRSFPVVTWPGGGMVNGLGSI